MYLRSIIVIVFLVSLAHCAVGFGPGLQLQDRLSQHLKDREELHAHLRARSSITDDVIPKFPLPRSLEPISYNVKIRPILNEADPEVGERFTAPGTVKIVFNCVAATNVITLHAFLLNINNNTISVTNFDSGIPVPVLATSSEPDKHFYQIKVEGLEPDTAYEVQLQYIAPVSRDRVNGLYLTSYEDPESGEPRYMAATQLEPARARQVFPCFDEPRWKPTFDVTIGRMVADKSLGNSPMVATVVDDEFDGWVWDIYNVTVPMPTYLFAMAVMFNYECKGVDPNLYRVPVQTCGAKHLIDEGRGDYSAEASALIINFFEEHYDLHYPMDKVDSIVVPGKGGAMENYGLVTYGDFLLYHADENSEIQRQRLVNVIAHELAHQWFGNLVTCVSWSHIYLNEGFATYVSFVGEEQFYDEFHPREYILNDAVQSAFILDAGPTSHPLVVEDIYTIDHISSHFSNLQYDKGAALIRMMEGFLTEGTLNAGLRAYLRKKAHHVAEQDELFEALTVQAITDDKLPEHESVKDIMDSWTLQRGFPLVRAQYWDANNIYLSQERFRNHGQEFPDPGNDLWEVPISIATQNNPNFQNYTPATWIHKNVNAKILRHDTSKWIMLNLDGMNFYRVLYDERLLSLIREQLHVDHSIISSLSRSQLLDDYLNLAWQRYVSIERALELTEYLSNETHFTVWNAFFATFRSAFQILSTSEASDSIKAYLIPRFDGALTKIGLQHRPDDEGALVLLRTQLLDWACSLGHEGCLNYANELLQRWQEDSDNQFQTDLQPVLYCTAVANGDASVLDFFIGQHSAVIPAEHKFRIVAALACIKEPALIDDLLQLSLNPTSGFSKPESALLLQSFAANSNARSKLFTFLETQLPAIIAFHESATPVAGVLTLLSPYYSTAEQLVQVRNFVTTNAEALISVRPQLDAALARIETNIQWRLNFHDRIQSWMETHI